MEKIDAFNTAPYISQVGDSTRAKIGHVNYIIDYINNNGLSGTTSITEVTYSELSILIEESDLLQNSYYLITDFQTCYDQPSYDYYGGSIVDEDTYKVSDIIEPLYVYALTNNTLDVNVVSSLYPNDSIKYDFSFNLTERTDSPAMGRITERIDDKNNRTDYDHRHIKFKRYKTYFRNDSRGGFIISTDGSGNVVGLNTSFLIDYIVDEVIYIEFDRYSEIFKIVSIADDTNMIISGLSINTENGEFRHYNTTHIELTDRLYYFNDNGSNYISDGGYDMYDGGNYIYTNISDENAIPYTHTQMDIDGDEAILDNFVMDGSVSVGSDLYFGVESSYFTNLYPGLFLLVADNINIQEFKIDGNNGADGSGSYDVLDYVTTVNDIQYSVFVKRVFDAYDPSINHIIITNTTQNLTHTTSTDTDDDLDIVSGLDDATQIHYLLLAKRDGVKITDQLINDVVDEYLTLTSTLSISNILATMNTNYTNITDLFVSGIPKYLSQSYKKTNIDENVGNEYHTFNSVNTYNNYIGDYSNTYEYYENDFLLANNVFLSNNNSYDVVSNTFGNNIKNNTFADDFRNNQISNNMSNNIIYDNFDRNVIGHGFRDNTISTSFTNCNICDYFSNNTIFVDEFDRNTIKSYFANNSISTDNSWYLNDICSYFGDNTIRSEFGNNTIKDSFEYNKIYDNFNYNDISYSFNNNLIKSEFRYNDIEYGFNHNNIYNYFNGNKIKKSFENNTIGSLENINDYNFEDNTIGAGSKGNYMLRDFNNNKIGGVFLANEISYFSGNTILGNAFFNTIGDNCYGNVFGNDIYTNNLGENFIDNTIGNQFQNNNILDNCQNNKIGNNFEGNNIDNDFGYDGTAFVGNTIGNNFISNIIRSRFNNNNICDLFNNNNIDSYFASNYITAKNISGVNFSIEKTIDSIGALATGSTATDDIYLNVPFTSTNGIGLNATFDITVIGGSVNDVLINNRGINFNIGDTLTILGSSILGTDGVDDINITVTDLTTNPKVYDPVNCNIFRIEDTSLKLTYYDEIPTIQVIDITM